MTNKDRLKKAKQLSDTWDENEETMGEMAAYEVSCQQLNIDSDDGWNLLHELSMRKSKD